MPIYDKSVRQLLRQFVSDKQITKGQTFSKKEVVDWFNSNFPKIKSGTINAHLIRMSTNAPSRIHYHVKQDGEDDLFYQIDGSHFRLYDEENDPQPIYQKEDFGDNGEDLDVEDPEPQYIESKEFAYERDLRNFLSRNLDIIEEGLTLYEEEGITGVEYPVGGRFIDILSLDMANNFVIVELKVSKGYDRVIGQLLRYMAWIEQNLAEPEQKTRGVIIANKMTEDLLLAASKVEDIELFEYDLSVSLRKISQNVGENSEP